MTSERDQWQRLLGLPADADSPAVCEAFERLALTLAPIELRDLPIYALPISTLPESFHTASRHTGGWYSDYGYHWARDYLPEDRGPGTTLFVQDVVSAADRSWLARSAQSLGYFRRGKHYPLADLLELIPATQPIEAVCRTLVHEFAHAISSICAAELQLLQFGINHGLRPAAEVQASFQQLQAQRLTEGENAASMFSSHRGIMHKPLAWLLTCSARTRVAAADRVSS